MLAEISHETYSKFPNDPDLNNNIPTQSFSKEVKDSPFEAYTISYLNNN